MQINPLLVKHYLKNVLFITGTAYAGKSTMVKMLAQRHNLLLCGENYECIPPGILTPEGYPNLCYFDTMRDWQEFVNRPPEQYEAWIRGYARENAEFEICYLMHVSQGQRVIVDTNMPVDILRQIADYNQVAIMLSPQSMSVDHFFSRPDSDKAFIRKQIMQAADPEKTMENFLQGIAKINSQDYYNHLANSGFFTLVRQNTDQDTREEVFDALSLHFGLDSPA